MRGSAPSGIERKIQSAVTLIGDCRGAVVALSAGVDSSLVALLAYKALGDHVIAITGVSESLSEGELATARKTAREIGIRHETVRTRELANLDYSSNPNDRCFYCKETLYGELRRIADNWGFQAVLDGTQTDDLGDDRPGLRAAREAHVLSPLLVSSFTKADVREAARVLGLSVWDKPATPCLSSRIAHGQEITSEKLRMVDQAESYIKRLTGVKDLRVRYNEAGARIEVSPDEKRIFFDVRLMSQVDGELRRLGFKSVALDMRGLSRREKVDSRDAMVLPMA